jgi:hypothetical protein
LAVARGEHQQARLPVAGTFVDVHSGYLVVRECRGYKVDEVCVVDLAVTADGGRSWTRHSVPALDSSQQWRIRQDLHVLGPQTLAVLIGGGCVAALVVDWIVHASDGRVRIGAAGTVAIQQLAAAVAALATVSLAVACCGIVIVLDENDGSLRFAARGSEILRLPPTLRIISADHCADGGSSGNRSTEFVVTATDGATRAMTVARLVDHLRRIGWPLQPTHSAYAGCRKTGGILPWTQHCLVLDTDPAPWRPPPPHPEAVVVFIDSTG